MSQLRQALKSLAPHLRDELKIAHTYEIARYVKLPDNKFIGVYLVGMRNLKIEEEHNDWYYGEIINQ